MPPVLDPALEASFYKKFNAVPRSMTPPVLRVLINGQPACVTLDTGAAISVMNEATLRIIFLPIAFNLLRSLL
jgi:hypothetical protein